MEVAADQVRGGPGRRTDRVSGHRLRRVTPRSRIARATCLRFTRRYQPCRDSKLMPGSRATAVTVLPEEPTSAIASRLNSSVYRFVYLFPTWCYFLWNLETSVSRCPRSRGSFMSYLTPRVLP